MTTKRDTSVPEGPVTISIFCFLSFQTLLVVLFFIVFQKRKNSLLLDKILQQRAFDLELSNAQTEIQEQTLKHIGWELHDNVGQLLAYASMQMNMNMDMNDGADDSCCAQACHCPVGSCLSVALTMAMPTLKSEVSLVNSATMFTSALMPQYFSSLYRPPIFA